MLTAQVFVGIYLKLHLEKGFLGRVRPYFVYAHGLLGKLLPVVSWVQMLFGGITAMGYCRDDHLGQCLAHFIMGSAFIGYGIVLTILLLVGQMWLRRMGRSQEFFDSLIITVWGIVNTFTEHRWGTAWVGNDIQHTTMGVVWWCAGLLGIWLSRKRDGRPKRNLIPAIVLMMTGWAMSAHPQNLELSTHVHTVFGYTLMAAGAVRIVEIAFVLKDRASVSRRATEETSSFQYLTPYVSLPAQTSPFTNCTSSSSHRASFSWARRKSKWPSFPAQASRTFPTFCSFTLSPSFSSSSSTFYCTSTPPTPGPSKRPSRCLSTKWRTAVSRMGARRMADLPAPPTAPPRCPVRSVSISATRPSSSSRL